MKTYTEGFYAVNGNRAVVGTNLVLSVPDNAVVEVFATLVDLDAAYPDLTNNISNNVQGVVL